MYINVRFFSIFCSDMAKYAKPLVTLVNYFVAKNVHMCSKVLMWNMKHEGMKTKQHKMLESGETPAIVCFCWFT